MVLAVAKEAELSCFIWMHLLRCLAGAYAEYEYGYRGRASSETLAAPDFAVLRRDEERLNKENRADEHEHAEEHE